MGWKSRYEGQASHSRPTRVHWLLPHTRLPAPALKYDRVVFAKYRLLRYPSPRWCRLGGGFGAKAAVPMRVRLIRLREFLAKSSSAIYFRNILSSPSYQYSSTLLRPNGYRATEVHLDFIIELMASSSCLTVAHCKLSIPHPSTTSTDIFGYRSSTISLPSSWLSLLSLPLAISLFAHLSYPLPCPGYGISTGAHAYPTSTGLLLSRSSIRSFLHPR